MPNDSFQKGLIISSQSYEHLIENLMTNTTTLSSEEQVVTPKRPFPTTTIEEIAGLLAHDGAPKTLAEIETAVQQAIAEAWQLTSEPMPKNTDI